MDKRPIFVLAGLLAASMALGQAYRWVDEDGVVHYSDRPQPGAEQVDLPRANTTAIRQFGTRPGQDAGDDPAEQEEKPVRYESIAVTSPADDQTLWNIEGVLSVSIALQPGLQPGHQMRVYFDGEPRLVSGTSFQIQEVYRGAHNIQAEVLDETGRLMIRSENNQFYVQQSTVNF